MIGVLLIFLYSTQKQVYDGDELYTFTLSNSKISGFIKDNIKFNNCSDILYR